LNFRFSSGAADTALAKPSGAGSDTSAHSPQSADFVGNVSVRRSVVQEFPAWIFPGVSGDMTIKVFL
jgi:hypothetical protein